MVEGESGILAIHRKNERPDWFSSRRELVWSNGTIAKLFSSADPEGLRGNQFGAAWCDELGCSAIDHGPNQPNVFLTGNQINPTCHSFRQEHGTIWRNDVLLRRISITGRNPQITRSRQFILAEWSTLVRLRFGHGMPVRSLGFLPMLKLGPTEKTGRVVTG